MTAVFLGSILFAGVGSLFTVLGFVMLFNLDGMNVEGNMPPIMLPMIFIGLGLICAVLGFAMLYKELCRRRQRRALREAGEFVWATVVDVFEDYSITVNGYLGLRVGLEWQDPRTGVLHRFVSNPQFKPLPGYPEGYQIKVYIDPRTGYSVYYVSLDEGRPGIEYKV